MIREILKDIKEILCPESRDVSRKLSKMSGEVDLIASDSKSYKVDSSASIIGGYISGKDEKGKTSEINLCDGRTYRVE